MMYFLNFEFEADHKRRDTAPHPVQQKRGHPALLSDGLPDLPERYKKETTLRDSAKIQISP